MIGADARALADDATVIERSLTEPDRFALVFDRHAPHIHRYLARRVGQQAADDLVAETFLTAFRKRTRYDPSHPDARPWLYGIATNLVSQHRREEIRRYRLSDLVGQDRFGADHAERVLAEVTSRSVRVVLSDALVGLSPGDQTCFC
jgi:DNA-directed RNA polymerase specialized sigma24 family protein